jgi:hypothetical protein
MSDLRALELPIMTTISGRKVMQTRRMLLGVSLGVLASVIANVLFIIHWRDLLRHLME